MEDGCDQRFIDATQLTVNYTLQDGAEATSFGHHFRVLQGCRGKTLVKEKQLTYVTKAGKKALQVGI